MSAVVSLGNFSNESTQLKGVSSFLADMLPFFTKRSLTYVDVGAYHAGVFAELLQSGLRIREAHLIEPNARSMAAAREQVGKLEVQHSVDFYNVALGAQTGRVKLHAAGTMTKIIEDTEAAATLGLIDGTTIEADCTTLDALSQNVTERHISLLKIDVEGHELDVLSGAKTLLREERIDVIYIEAGMNPKGTQQCYYRHIEDFLRKFGYGLFRIYEQHHEWMEDSPLLRRVNLAFMSRSFAQSNPYRLTKDLHKANERLESVKQKLDNAASQIAALERASKDAQIKLQTATSERDDAKLALTAVEAKAQKTLTEMQTAVAEHESLKKALARTEETATTLSGEIEKLTKERERLDQDLSATQLARDALLAEQQALTAAHKQTLDTLERRLTEAQRARDALLTDHRALTAAYDQAKSELHAASVARNELAAEAAEVTARLAEATKRHDALAAALLEAERTSTRLSTTIESLVRERQDLSQALTQSQLTQNILQAEFQSVKAERDSIKASFDASEEAVAAMQERLDAAQQTNAALEQHIAEARSQLERADNQRDSLQAELVRSVGTAIALTTEIEQLSEERRELEIMLSDSHATRRELSTEIDRVVAERDGIEATRKAERQTLEAALATAEAHSGTLTARISQLAVEHQALAHALDASQNARRGLSAELDIVTAARDHLEKSLKQAETAERSLSLELRDLTAERSKLQETIKTAENTAEDYRLRLLGSEQTNRTLESNINAATTKASALAQQCLSLKASLCESEKNLSKLSSKCDTLSAQREDFKTNLQKSRNDRDKLSKKLQAAITERDGTKEKLRNAEKIVDAYQEDLEASQQTSQQLQATLRDLFESTAQLHRRELRVLKELRRIRSKITPEDGGHDVNPNDAPEEASAQSVIKFPADTNTIYVPFTLTRHTIVVPSSKGGHLISMTYLAEPSATGSVEVTLRPTQGLDHVVAVGDEKLLPQIEPAVRQLDVRPGRSIRLLELQTESGEVTFELRRARGFFGVLKLEQTSSNLDPPLPVKRPKSRVALLANALGVGATAPEAPAQMPRFSPHELCHKLWGGFSRYAIPELEKWKLDSRASLADRESAAWYLTQWFAVEEEFSRAIENIHFSKHLVGKLRQKFALAEAQCLIQLARYSQALTVLDRAIAAKPVLDYYLLRSTVIRHLEISNGTPSEHAEQAQLEALNIVFQKAGVAPLKKRRADLPLTLGNITAIATAKTAEQEQKLSIVIPAFNAAETIEWVLQSLLEQTWRNLEIIVVDDVSKDNTCEVVEAVSQRDSRVRLLRQRVNSGAYASRNAGVRVATGDYLMVHDSDDWSHPQRIEMQIAALNANPKCVAVKSYWVRVGNSVEILGAWVPKQTLLDLNYSSLLFRRDLMEKTGLWDEVSVGGDAEFYARLRALYGEESVLKICNDTPLALALTREDSLTRSKATHLKSNYYGLRWNYIDSCRFWHTRLQHEQVRSELTPARTTLPFAAPLGNQPKKGSVPHYDLVVIADLAAEGQSLDRTLHYLRSAANAGLKVGVFHWRQYEHPTRSPLQTAFYETRLRCSIDVLSPGDSADAQMVLFTQPEILQHRIDPMPTIRAKEAAAIVDETYSGDPLLARAHLHGIFGIDAFWIPVTETAKCLIQADRRFPAPSDISCLKFGF